MQTQRRRWEIKRHRWKVKMQKAHKSWSISSEMPHHPPALQTTIIMLLHKPGDIYILSLQNMFTKRPFQRWKKQTPAPWTVPWALSDMNKPCSAIVMKESASCTHRNTESDALSVEPVSRHWLLVVILSRDWSWQSWACQATKSCLSVKTCGCSPPFSPGSACKLSA